MKKITFLFLFSISSMVFAQEPEMPKEYPFGAPDTEARGVFGDDDRKEVQDAYGYEDFVRATAVMVNKNSFYENKFYAYTLRERLSNSFESDNFDENVKFLDQPALGTCTGFLIAPDILVTAGHCVDNLEDAQKYVWVFDYSEDKINFETESHSLYIPSSKVYEVEKVYDAILDDDTEQDYAVLKLNKASSRAPYRFRTSGEIGLSTVVNTIGSPTGLPLKFSGKAVVVENDNEKWFKTNIDAFPGNSGGPVFDKNGFLEGILVRGATQYDYARDTYTGDYRYDTICNCVKTVKFNSTYLNAGCQISKISDIPYSLKILAIYENLRYAIEQNMDDRFDQWKTYKWIFSKKYSPENKKHLLNIAVDKHYNYAITTILSEVKDELTESENRNLLYSAYVENDYNLMQIFLNNDIYPDVKGSASKTILQMTVEDKNLKMMKLLVDYGADVNVTNGVKNNLLHVAASLGDIDICNYLIGKGVSLDAENYDGDKPEKVAKNAGYKELYKYLKDARKS